MWQHRDVLTRARNRTLELLRSNGREVAWTPEWMGLGNVLYLTLWAFLGRETGGRHIVLRSEVLARWLPLFGGLAGYSLAREDVRLTDKRVRPWEREADGRPWFSCEQLDAFLVAAGLDESVRRRAEAVGLVPRTDQLVVNVRRGDYYDNPTYRADFGFDVEGYLRHAVPASIERDGPVRRVRVVSDGIVWCRAHLSWLDDLAEEVSYAEGGSPERDLLEVASSPRLVITNSTFSYWGAYLSNAVHGRHSSTWAPRFFRRTGAPTTDLDPRWTIVETLPGGWDVPGDSPSERA